MPERAKPLFHTIQFAYKQFSYFCNLLIISVLNSVMRWNRRYGPVFAMKSCPLKGRRNGLSVKFTDSPAEEQHLPECNILF